MKKINFKQFKNVTFIALSLLSAVYGCDDEDLKDQCSTTTKTRFSAKDLSEEMKKQMIIFDSLTTNITDQFEILKTITKKKLIINGKTYEIDFGAISLELRSFRFLSRFSISFNKLSMHSLLDN